ncbi:MAG: hypothetical protein H6867_09875 [Rhodospirillales bacterium]|nr:hypothetical protein [Rhodospirillales bacterium]MCB9995909.1 hypothetical protein [Rhodospirillales bacterium]
MRLLLSTLLLMVLSLPAMAEGFVYSPEGCEFQITFPSEPQVTRRCHDKVADKCALMTSYTEVISLDATLNFYVSCRSSEKNYREDFSPDLMRTSLLARPDVDRLEVYDINFQESDQAVMGSLLGAGPSPNGNDPMIYVAQLWVGDASVFSLEAELIGPQSEEADQHFANILRSLHHNDWEPPQAAEETASAGEEKAVPPAAETEQKEPETPAEP